MAKLDAALLLTIKVNHCVHVQLTVLIFIVFLELFGQIWLLKISLSVFPVFIARVSIDRSHPFAIANTVDSYFGIFLRILVSLQVRKSFFYQLLVVNLGLLILFVSFELDHLLELAAHFRGVDFVPDFVHCFHLTQADFWHIVRWDRTQEAEIQHDQGVLVPGSYLLELRLVCRWERPTGLAGHQGAHHQSVVVCALITGQV